MVLKHPFVDIEPVAPELGVHGPRPAIMSPIREQGKFGLNRGVKGPDLIQEAHYGRSRKDRVVLAMESPDGNIVLGDLLAFIRRGKVCRYARHRNNG